MSSKLHMCGVMRVVLLGLMISSWAGWVSAEEPKKEGTDDVQRRAVPQQGRPGVVAPTVGVIIESNQLRAMPGYTLQVGPNNTVSAKPISRGPGLSFSGQCGCLGTGSCTEVEGGATVTCTTIPPDFVCTGTCEWFNKKVTRGQIMQ